MDYAAFSLRLKEAAEPPAGLIFHGAEPYLMERGAALAAERWGLQPAGRLYGNETPWDPVAAALGAGFLLGPRRLVTLIYRGKVPADHAAALGGLAATPALLCAMIPAPTLPFKPTAASWAVKCDHPNEELLARWIRKELAARGHALASEALGPLVQAFHNQPLHGCLNVLETISCHAGPGAAVGRPQIEPFVPPSLRANTFKILDALAARRPAEAMAVVRELLAHEEPALKIHGGVVWGFQKLLEAHHRRRAGHNRIEVARTLGVKYGADGYVALAERMGPRGLRRGLEALQDADRRLKVGGVRGTAETTMEMMVTRLGLAVRE